MSFTKLLKIGKLLKEKDIDPNMLLSFIDNLSQSFTLQEANELALKNKSRPNTHKDLKELSEKEIAAIKKEMIRALEESIEKELSDFPKISIYQEPVPISKGEGEEEKEELIYNRLEYVKDLTQTFSYLADNFSENFTFQDEDIHPTLECEYPNTPDTKIASYKVPAQTVSLNYVGVEKDYLRYDEKTQTEIFKELHSFTLEQPALFFKDISYLQLFAMWGLNDLIEKCVVYGADIHYREKIHNKTALEMYDPSTLNPPELTNYIKSLLDGSYDNGYYQVLYEKKKLEQNMGKQEVDSKKPQFKL